VGRPGRPVVFIHGLWKSAAIWDRWCEKFAAEGYMPVAPLWPGERATVQETRRHPEDMEGVSLNDAVRHFEREIRQLAEAPILIGHSFGALIAEKILASGSATAAVAIDPAQSGSALPASLERLREDDPNFGLDVFRSSVISLSADQFKDAFCDRASEEDAAEYYRLYAVPSSVNPLLQVGTPGFRLIPEHSTGSAGPLLLLPATRAASNARVTDDPSILVFRDSISVEENLQFADRGHALVFDHGWGEVADTVVDWLEGKGLQH
jgi:pimeloyl-ACP methyl ester carboxylesterase